MIISHLSPNSLVVQNPNECPIRTTVNKGPNEGELPQSVFELLGFGLGPILINVNTGLLGDKHDFWPPCPEKPQELGQRHYTLVHSTGSYSLKTPKMMAFQNKISFLGGPSIFSRSELVNLYFHVHLPVHSNEQSTVL